MSLQLSRRASGLYAPLRDAVRPPSRVELHYTITPIDQWGNPIGRTKRRKAHSWTKQAAHAFNAFVWGINSGAVVKETDATLDTLGVTDNGSVAAAVGILTSGIVVGTGAAAESSDDFVLTTPVAHGVGAGQLSYSAETLFTPPASITGGYRCRTSRQVDNASGGSIVVTEIALYMQEITALTTFCIIRDVLVTAETITNLTGRVIEYQADFLN
jgi:hypothetical protein